MPSAAAARSTGLMLMGCYFTRQRPLIGPRRGLPTASQGLVDRNQAGGGLGTAAGQPILGLQLVSLGIQHLQEVVAVVFITQPGEAGGRAAGVDGLLVVDQA